MAEPSTDTADEPDDEIEAFTNYLQDTLIPDLEDINHTETAADLVRCCNIIQQLKRERDDVRRVIAGQFRN